MNSIPTLVTTRLMLRPFTLEDAPMVQRLAGAWEVAKTVSTIPHPYNDGMAEEWISTHQETFAKGEAVIFAIVLRQTAQLIGAISLRLKKSNFKAELGYWIGTPYWNRGYCTEAAQAVIQYGFNEHNLNRIQAQHFTINPASGRVMQKIGMQYEGTLRQSLFCRDQFHDVAVYGILRSEFLAAQKMN